MILSDWNATNCRTWAKVKRKEIGREKNSLRIKEEIDVRQEVIEQLP